MKSRFLHFYIYILMLLLLYTPIAGLSQNSSAPEIIPTATLLPKIEKVTPEILYVEQGKMQETYALIQGAHLNQVRGALVYRNGAPYVPVLARFVPTAASSQKLAFLVAPSAPLDGAYRVALVTQNKELIWVPLKLQVVAPGDSRLGPSNSSEAAISKQTEETQPADTLKIAKKDAPLVTGVEPSTFIPATGQPQTYVIKGNNLNKITQLGLRAIEGDNKVNVPFQFTEDGILFQLMTRPNAIVGTKYALDLIMDQYLVATFDFSVGSAAEQTRLSSQSEPAQPAQPPLSAESWQESSTEASPADTSVQSPPPSEETLEEAPPSATPAPEKRLKIRTR